MEQDLRLETQSAMRPSAPEQSAPEQSAPIDPAVAARAAARASLAAGRSPSLWWTLAGLALSAALVLTLGVSVGALALAIGLAAAALARAVLPSPGPVAYTVRSRVLDVAVLAVLAAAIGTLSQLIPTS